MRFAAFKNFVCDQAPIQLLDSTVGLCLKLKKQNNNTFRCALTFSFQTQILSSKIILFLLYFLLPYNLFEKFVIVTLGSYPELNNKDWNCRDTGICNLQNLSVLIRNYKRAGLFCNTKDCSPQTQRTRKEEERGKKIEDLGFMI